MERWDFAYVLLQYLTFICWHSITLIHNEFSVPQTITAAQCLIIVLVFVNILVLSLTELITSPTIFRGGVVRSAFKSLVLWAVAIPLFHLTAILFGAPFYESSSETFHFACLLSTCSVLPCSLVIGTKADAWVVLFTRNKSKPGLETIVKCSSLGSLCGAWLGAFPIPLDWDRPWQVWPISCILGTIGGYLLGLTVGALYSITKSRTPKKLL